MSLIIDNIDVKVKEKKILKKFSLNIKDGEVHAIMGPNGTGKSTLSKVIMGSSDYRVTSGDILFDNESIKDLEVDERARKGIFLAMQNPLTIEGVKNSEFLRTALSNVENRKVGIFEFMKLIDSNIKDLNIDSNMVHRSINKDFSGGEKKKNEILQMKILKPKFIILDELDSGLDVDSLKIVCDNINNYLKNNKEVSVLIITHYPKILEYIKPDFVHVLKDGKIVKTSDFSLAFEIEKKGYGWLNDISESDVYE